MLWRRVADARENERGGGGEHGIRRARRRRRGGTDGRVLCAARLSSTAAPAVVFSQPHAIPRRVPVAGAGEGSEEREIGRRAAEGRIRIGRRPSESSTEISLASLRFRIRDSRGAANLPSPAEENFFFRSFSGLRGLLQPDPRARNPANIQQEIPLPQSAGGSPPLLEFHRGSVAS